MSDVKCPCACADGVAREMQAGGSCDCRCRCDDGVSSDTIAADGSCPCSCTCKNGEMSRIGRNGRCQCRKDICPRCPSGEQAEWRGNVCQCPEACGTSPTCPAGRRGPTCEQPDCFPYQDCSGHGVCRKGAECHAACQCNRRWQGMW